MWQTEERFKGFTQGENTHLLRFFICKYFTILKCHLISVNAGVFILLFFYSFKVLAKEVGDGFNITTLLNDSSGWRGRQQQITSLQNKVKFILKLFVTSAVFSASSNISSTRKSVSSDIQTPRSGWKNDAQPSFFFNQLQSVWISDKAPFRKFDKASQTINNSWRNSKQKFTKFYDN